MGDLLVLTLCVATFQATADDRLGAMGIGVSDLARSSMFYQEVLGLKVLRTYELGYLDEIVLGYEAAGNESPAGAVVVLMHWPDQRRDYDGNNVKLVFYVTDPGGVIERIRERGGRIDREAAPIEALDGTVVGLGRDPDNHVVEVIQR